MIDLVDFGGTYISLSSIHAVVNEMEDQEETGNVFIEYGPNGARAGFEGSAADVMRIIEDWRRNNSAMASAGRVPQAVLAAV
ncbi:hypothetical protein CQ020_03670 [Arthrobacter sp. MYb23]|uniref:hypothetical protein n=1 Tax=unclassified Arthrobacter TaxID=235627 RepID=UPI000CFD3184|nr:MULTISPECIES: hypothetical protein [unclassified Arthrobacter]PRB44319.1 hypothetical protein CQ038_03525 [Arthrobacter sp. MYb51]PRB98571.1 hypothetical protein CQ020_03670 [Arthrobacter sp. MYb23]